MPYDPGFDTVCPKPSRGIMSEILGKVGGLQKPLIEPGNLRFDRIPITTYLPVSSYLWVYPSPGSVQQMDVL